MNARVVTKLLVIIYGLSITGFGIMELGHEIAHVIKNKVHHHDAALSHVVSDHGLKSQEEHSDDNNISLLSCGFLFFEVYSFLMETMLLEVQYFCCGNNKHDNVILKPFIPPPAKIS